MSLKIKILLWLLHLFWLKESALDTKPTLFDCRLGILGMMSGKHLVATLKNLASSLMTIFWSVIFFRWSLIQAGS